MKTLISYFAFAALVITSSFTIDSQQKLNEQSTPSCFSFFRAHRQAQGAAMSWAVSTPDVVHFIIERSYDDYYYETAGTVSYNTASTYKFQDTDVYPGYVFYRIVAVKSDGSTECSSTERIRIVKRH
jgi:hypothetical protein